MALPNWLESAAAECLAIPGSEKLERLQREHAPEALNEWVASLRQRFRGRYAAVAVEQTRGGLVHSLMQHEFMVLYLINPSTSAKFRGAWKPSRAKNDITDAELLTEILTGMTPVGALTTSSRQPVIFSTYVCSSDAPSWAARASPFLSIGRTPALSFLWGRVCADSKVSSEVLSAHISIDARRRNRRWRPFPQSRFLSEHRDCE